MFGGLALCFVAQRFGSSEEINVSVDGVSRHAIVYRPSAGRGPCPVVFAFHGHGGTAKYSSRRFNIQGNWPEALVIYADGLPTTSIIDPKGQAAGWEVVAAESNKDLKFFDKLYDLAIKKYGGAPTKVFSMGHSNGALFTFTLWAMRGSKFVGFGSFEGIKPRTGTLTPAKPLFITIGERDAIVPARMQHQTLSEVLSLDGCATSASQYEGKAVIHKGTNPVVLWSYAGGHMFQADAIPTMVRFFRSLVRR